MPGESSRQKHGTATENGWPMATAANNACNFTYRWPISGARSGAAYCNVFSSYKKYRNIVSGRDAAAICESVKSIIDCLPDITCDVLTNIKGTVGRFHAAVPSTNVIRHVSDVD